MIFEADMESLASTNDLELENITVSFSATSGRRKRRSEFATTIVETTFKTSADSLTNIARVRTREINFPTKSKIDNRNFTIIFAQRPQNTSSNIKHE
jgi:hypothetical protein